MYDYIYICTVYTTNMVNHGESVRIPHAVHIWPGSKTYEATLHLTTIAASSCTGGTSDAHLNLRPVANVEALVGKPTENHKKKDKGLKKGTVSIKNIKKKKTANTQ